MIGLRVEFARRAGASPDAMAAAVNGLAFGTASALANAVKTRVAERGDPAQPFAGYASSDGDWPYFVSSRYPVQPAGSGANGRMTASGAQFWLGSDEYRDAAGVVPGSFNVSGGMWDGLTVQLVSSTMARFFFRGRSEGQRPRWRRDRKGQAKARGVKESNAMKAATILTRTGVNVLALTEREFDQVAAAIQGWLLRGVDLESLAVIQWPAGISVAEDPSRVIGA